jgi:Concanavalin A-like lectin/glucanases superfamily
MTRLALGAAAGLLVATALTGRQPVAAADAAPPALHLPFETLDARLKGNGWLVPGVVGHALQLDGIAAHVRVPAVDVPRLAGSFTVEGWVALGAYPFNDAPILQQQDGDSGWFLGVGDRGQIRFDVGLGAHRLGTVSAEHLPLRRWAYVVGVFDPARGASLYINGTLAGNAAGTGAMAQAQASDLWIGRNAREMEQSAPVGAGRQQPTRILLDGILDELTITQGAVSAADVAATYAGQKPSTAPPLEARSLPTVPPGPAPFGAVYTRLHYYKGWDDVWRVADSPDVVVRFDRAPYWFVFWRGTSYIPHWVTENGIWYDNEFTETFPPGMVGSDARVVVHWRYAPLGVGYLPAYPDPLTDWADWTDEIHTIYPDGVGVRKIIVHTSKPEADREWHEGIVVMGPGMSPNEALESPGLLLANSRGESVDISWEKATPPRNPPQPEHTGIQRINTRSRFRPFAIARWQDDPRFDVYAGEIRRDVSIYPWWNHWPTAFEPSNGRYALAADRASHTSLTHMYWKPLSSTPNSVTKVHLEGMTDGGAAELATLARSWEAPAALTIDTPGASGGAYDPGERAWILERSTAARGAPIAFTLVGSEASPIDNATIIVKGWGDGAPSLTMGGRRVARGSGFRIGYIHRLEATDLVIFVTVRATSPVRLVLTDTSSR